MNFTAKSMKTGAEKTFFAELFLSYKVHYTEGYVVTACSITWPESLGKNSF